MINKIMASPIVSQNNTLKTTPSFGMAKLNQKGRDVCDELHISRNSFVRQDLYKKAGLFQKPAIHDAVGNQGFTNICEKYGCTNNGDANAQFIKTQILPKKALNKLPVEENDLSEGLVKLYEHNYDNPALTSKETKQLLDLIESEMTASEYSNQVGLLEVGTSN